MIGGEQEDEEKLGVEPAVLGPIMTPEKARARPRTQLASIAGVVMYLSSLRSITLKVSDCSEPVLLCA